MKLPLRFERREGFEEQMRILKRPYGDHEGYARDNDGTWIILDAEGNGVIRVAFQGTAKRGQGWNAPDPEGMRIARLLVDSFNAHVGDLLDPADKMAEGIRRAVASGALDPRSMAADAELIYTARRNPKP